MPLDLEKGCYDNIPNKMLGQIIETGRKVGIVLEMILIEIYDDGLRRKSRNYFLQLKMNQNYILNRLDFYQF